MSCFIYKSIYQAHTAHKGRGVFSVDNLTADMVVETSPVIILSAKDRKHLVDTPLADYIFGWQVVPGPGCCVGLGYLSIYNHAYAANCHYTKDYEAGTMSIRTRVPIPAGEELTINYNGTWDDEKPRVV